MAFTIISNQGARKEPMVTVTQSGPQWRIALNAALVRELNLKTVTKIVMAWDHDLRRLQLSAYSNDRHRNAEPYSLHQDGGQRQKQADGRALYISRTRLPGLTEGQYKPESRGMGRTAEIVISLDPLPAVFSSPTEIRSGIRGVYKILDGDGHIIDIGQSCGSDVRGRVRTKWKTQPEARTVEVYELASEEDCFHWERVFQKRLSALPKYCSVSGPGCGCVDCD